MGWNEHDPEGQLVCSEACEALHRDSCVVATLAQRVSDLFTSMKLKLQVRDGAQIELVMRDLQAAVAATTSMARTCHDNERLGLSLLQRLAYHCDKGTHHAKYSIPSKDASKLQPIQHHVDQLHQALLSIGKSLDDVNSSQISSNPCPDANCSDSEREFEDSMKASELPWDRYPLEGISRNRRAVQNAELRDAHIHRNDSACHHLSTERIRGEHELCIWLLNVVQSDISELQQAQVSLCSRGDADQLQLQWKIQELQGVLHTTKMTSKKDCLELKAANAALRRKVQESQQKYAALAAKHEKMRHEFEAEKQHLAALVDAGEEERRTLVDAGEEERRTREEMIERLLLDREQLEETQRAQVPSAQHHALQEKYESLLVMSAGLQNKYERLVDKSLSTTKALEAELAEKDALMLQLRLEATTEVCSA